MTEPNTAGDNSPTSQSPVDLTDKTNCNASGVKVGDKKNWMRRKRQTLKAKSKY